MSNRACKCWFELCHLRFPVHTAAAFTFGFALATRLLTPAARSV